MGLFTPAWKGKNREKACNAIERMTDQKKLVMAAKNAYWPEAQAAAIRKIHDDDVLLEIVDYILIGQRYIGDNSYQFSAVAKQLTSKECLQKFADNNRIDAEARMKAYERLCDEQGIENMVVKILSNIYKADFWELETRKDLITKLKNETKVADLITNALNYQIAKWAWELNLIKSQKLLAEIAENERMSLFGLSDIRHDAILMLNDEKALKRITLNSNNVSIRGIAEKQLALVRKKAVKKMTDKEELKDIAINDPDDSVRIIAVNKITDEETLIRVAMNDTIDYIREKAIAKIKNQEALCHIAKNNKVWSVRLKAYRKLKDYDEVVYESLYKIVNEPYLIRKKAAIRLVELLKNNHTGAKLFWNSISTMCRGNHKDYVRHHHDIIRSSDCSHNDYDKHTDSGGIGIDFPPYPFND
jgi:hypothetical protein